MRDPDPQPVMSPLAWARHDAKGDAVTRGKSAAIIRGVLRRMAGREEMEILLAIGEACPFTSRYDRRIWTEEANRQLYVSMSRTS
jgi:hypothetical protein